MSTVPPLKPIPTRYNDYRFRSRLEARWALFFDHLGIAYQYEPEGFEHGEIPVKVAAGSRKRLEA